MPVPRGLVRISAIARLRAGVGEDARRIDGAGDRIAKLDLAIADRVPAEQRDAGFAQLVEAAAEDRGDGFGIEIVFGKRRDRQRRERTAAHRIHVAQRIGRGDLAVEIRVVHDRREEIDRLHQRRSTLPRVHTGIVRSPVVNQDAWVGLDWYSAQHLSELAGCEFARSTSAADHLGQPAPLLSSRVILFSVSSGIRRSAAARLRW